MTLLLDRPLMEQWTLSPDGPPAPEPTKETPPDIFLIIRHDGTLVTGATVHLTKCRYLARVRNRGETVDPELPQDVPTLLGVEHDPMVWPRVRNHCSNCRPCQVKPQLGLPEGLCEDCQ